MFCSSLIANVPRTSGPWLNSNCKQTTCDVLTKKLHRILVMTEHWVEFSNIWKASWMALTLTVWGRVLLSDLSSSYYIYSMAEVPCIWLPTKATLRLLGSFSKLAVTWISKMTWVDPLAGQPLLIPAHTSSYLFILAHTSSYRLIPTHTCSYQLISVHTGSYQFIPAHTGSYLFILAHTFLNLL